MRPAALAGGTGPRESERSWPRILTTRPVVSRPSDMDGPDTAPTRVIKKAVTVAAGESDVDREAQDLRVSEVYRGYAIYYSPATRRWFVELHKGTTSDAFAAAFQARRAINQELDGSSVPWPKRSPG